MRPVEEQPSVSLKVPVRMGWRPRAQEKRGTIWGKPAPHRKGDVLGAWSSEPSTTSAKKLKKRGMAQTICTKMGKGSQIILSGCFHFGVSPMKCLESLLSSFWMSIVLFVWLHCTRLPFQSMDARGMSRA